MSRAAARRALRRHRARPRPAPTSISSAEPDQHDPRRAPARRKQGEDRADIDEQGHMELSGSPPRLHASLASRREPRAQPTPRPLPSSSTVTARPSARRRPHRLAHVAPTPSPSRFGFRRRDRLMVVMVDLRQRRARPRSAPSCGRGTGGGRPAPRRWRGLEQPRLVLRADRPDANAGAVPQLDHVPVGLRRAAACVGVAALDRLLLGV